MGLKQEITCDFCGKPITMSHHNWFKVSQPEKDEAMDTAKLKEDVYVCDLFCLEGWVEEAREIESLLQEDAKSLIPRGKLFSDKRPELYI